MHIKYFVFIVLFTHILISCKNETVTEKEIPASKNSNELILSKEQLKNADIAIGSLEKISMSHDLSLNGTIDVPPQNMISVSFPMGGYLKSIKLLPGAKVKKGEIVSIIEDQRFIELQRDYLSAKAKLLYSEKEYYRQKELNASKASSDKQFQQSEADYNTNLISVNSLAEQLKLIGINPKNISEKTITRAVSITAPANGFVSKVNVNTGKYISPSDVLFEIVDPSDIHLNLTVFEKDIDKLKIGQKLLAWTNTAPNKKFPCEIILIGKDLTNNRSTDVHCHFESYDHTLVPGMYMSAVVHISSDSIFALPNDAIVNKSNNSFVFIANDNGKFELKNIKTGYSSNGFTEILDYGNLTNAKVVTKNAYILYMTMFNGAND